VTPIARRRVRFEFVVDGVVDRKGLGRVGHRDRVGRTVHRIVDRAIVVVVETAAAVADEEDNYHFREAYSWEVRPFEMGVAVALDVRVDVVQEVEIVDDEDLLVALEVGRNPVSWDIVVVADLALVVMDEGALEIVVVVVVAAAAAAEFEFHSATQYGYASTCVRERMNPKRRRISLHPIETRVHHDRH